MDLYIQFPFNFQRTCPDHLEMFEILCWNVNGDAPANDFLNELDFYDKEVLIEGGLKKQDHICFITNR